MSTVVWPDGVSRPSFGLAAGARARVRAFGSDPRRCVQVALGLAWLLDGILQFQSFMYSDGFIAGLRAGTAGQPPWVADAMNWAIGIAARDLTLWNTLFALTQVVIGLGLLWRRTTTTALVVSFAWVLVVWLFGEGLGGLVSGAAQPLTGAPGAVLLYGGVGLIVWPGGRRGGLLGERGARVMWAGLWLVMAWLWMAPANRSPDATRAVLLSGGSGWRWLTDLQVRMAGGAAGHGLAIAIVMAALCVGIALGVATGRGARLALGPLFVLLAAAMYPLFRRDRGARRHELRVPVWRPAGLIVATLATVGALSGVALAATSGYTGVIPASGAPALTAPVVYRSHHGVLNVTLTASEQAVDIGGQTLLAKVYNGSFVAPTLMIKPGDMVRVKLINHLDEPTNLHFHGLDVSPSGHADNIFVTVNPGRSFQYAFRLSRDHASGTYWYHSHVMVAAGEMAKYPLTGSEEQVFDGLSGLIEVEGLSHDLPRSMREIPQQYLALRDVQAVDGQIVSADIDSDAPTTRLIDGQIDPTITIAPGQTQLWHIANIGADIFYRLTLPGHTFDVIAQDGHPVIHATEVTTLVMPPGKRWDVLVQGTQPGITHLETLPFSEGIDYYPQSLEATVLTAGDQQHPQTLPRKIVPDQINLLTRHAVRNRTITFDETHFGGIFSINGQVYQENRIQFHAKLGTVEQWTIVNDTSELHVFHMHTYPQQLVSVNGVRSAFNGYQDEADVPIHGSIVMRIWFRRFTGTTVFHCHILSHEDMGMMANIRVTR